MTNIEIMKTLLDNYKFCENIPAEIRKDIMRSKKEVLINVLKSAGKYSVIVLILINIFLLLKKAGLGISLAKTAMISTAATIAVTSASIAGAGIAAYQAINHSAEVETAAAIETPIVEEIITETIAETPKAPQQKTAPEIIYKLAIMPLRASSDISTESTAFTNALLKQINIKKGRHTATKSSPSKIYDTRYLLNGSIAKIDNQYHINVRIIDSENSQILTQTSSITVESDDFNSAAKTIAAEILSFIE